jgi:hypothetical protein
MAAPPIPVQDLRRVTFLYISDRIAKGRYLGIEVLILRSNGFIQGNDIAALGRTRGGKEKRLDNWLAMTSTKDMIAAIGGNKTAAIYVKDLPNDLRGTYLHPDLVPFLAAWTSPDLGMKISRIVNSFAIEEAEEKFRQALATTNEGMRKTLLARDEAVERVKTMTTEHQAEIEILRKEFDSEVQTLKAEHQSLVDQLKTENKDFSVRLFNTKMSKQVYKSSLEEANAAREEMVATREDEIERQKLDEEHVMRTSSKNKRKVERTKEKLSNLKEDFYDLKEDFYDLEVKYVELVMEFLRAGCECVHSAIISRLRRELHLPNGECPFKESARARLVIHREKNEEYNITTAVGGSPINGINQIEYFYIASRGTPAEMTRLVADLTKDNTWIMPGSLKISPSRWDNLKKELMGDYAIYFLPGSAKKREIFAISKFKSSEKEVAEAVMNSSDVS